MSSLARVLINVGHYAPANPDIADGGVVAASYIPNESDEGAGDSQEREPSCKANCRCEEVNQAGEVDRVLDVERIVLFRGSLLSLIGGSKERGECEQCSKKGDEEPEPLPIFFSNQAGGQEGNVEPGAEAGTGDVEKEEKGSCERE